jgi:hypothetical protein
MFIFHPYSSHLIACTGHVSIASWQLQVPHWSGPTTFDFSSTSSKTRGQTSAQWPQPMHSSSSTTGPFGTDILLRELHQFLLWSFPILTAAAEAFFAESLLQKRPGSSDY